MSFSFRKLLAAIPLINFIFQFLFIVPDVDDIAKIFDILGLLSALLLVVVYAIPGTVTFDELQAGDVRSVGGKNSSFAWTRVLYVQQCIQRQ